MTAFAKKLLVFILGSVAADVCFAGLMNKAEGKTFWGKPKKYVNTAEAWNGNVYAGEDDYTIE